MILLLKFQGRLSEVREFIVSGWKPGTSPVELIREPWDRDFTNYPIEGVRKFLDDASRSAPDEHRVLLAKTNLAARLGVFEEASIASCPGIGRTRRIAGPIIRRSMLAVRGRSKE